MDNKEFNKVLKVCWEHDVFVVVKPITRGRYKLAISRNKREKLGENVYEDKPVNKTLIFEKNGKKYRQDVTIPSVHQMIEKLYFDLYEKNFKGMEPQPVEPLDYDLFINNKAQKNENTYSFAPVFD
ncbi:MAG: hypothetical protein J0M25_00795 [Flavobacteriales bacterium]|nr:hypothetical protein [Flavobacteriales bacterium]